MEKKRSRNISTEEVAVRIQEDLDDFYNDELISSNAFSKKNTFINILRAINHADRIIARDMNLTGSVVVYVPADTDNVIFSEQYRYESQVLSDIQSQAADLIDRDEAYFLAKNQYLDVISILDRYIYVHDEYPSGSEKNSARLKKISEEDYRGIANRARNAETGSWTEPYYDDLRKEDAYCYFVPDEGRLVIGKMFKSPKFLTFRGRLMPGIIQMQDISENEKKQKKWNIYQIQTPHWGLELMVSEALLWLLPRSASNARGIVKQERNEQKVGFENSKPGDSNVIVPHHSW